MERDSLYHDMFHGSKWLEERRRQIVPGFAEEAQSLISSWPESVRDEETGPLTPDQLLQMHTALLSDVERELATIGQELETLEQTLDRILYQQPRRNINEIDFVEHDKLYRNQRKAQERNKSMQVIRCFLRQALVPECRGRWVSSLVWWWHGVVDWQISAIPCESKLFKDNLVGAGGSHVGAPWYVESALESKLNIDEYTGSPNKMGIYRTDVGATRPHGNGSYVKVKLIYVGSNYKDAMKEKRALEKGDVARHAAVQEHFEIERKMFYIEDWAIARASRWNRNVEFNPDLFYAEVNENLRRYEQLASLESELSAAREGYAKARTDWKEHKKLKDQLKESNDGLYNKEFRKKYRDQKQDVKDWQVIYETLKGRVRGYDDWVESGWKKRIDAIKKSTNT